MSNRFYVNGVQIFGNNEMFDCTYEELKRQGGDWDDDNGILPEMEVKDPQSLMEAVTKDSLTYLKECLTEKKKFDDLTDSDLILNNSDSKWLKKNLYKEDGTPDPLAFIHAEWDLKRMRAFTPFFLYLAIRDCVNLDYNTMKLSLKEGEKIIAEMH